MLPLNAALVANEENAAKVKCLRLSFSQSCALTFKVLGVNKSRFVLCWFAVSEVD